MTVPDGKALRTVVRGELYQRWCGSSNVEMNIVESNR